MLKESFAHLQASTEALRWLGAEPYSDVSLRAALKAREHRLASLVVASRVAARLPSFGFEPIVRRLLLPEHDLLGLGAETIVLNSEQGVDKLITGKSHDPQKLAERLTRYHEVMSNYISRWLPPTEVDVVEVKLFRHIPVQSYVRLRQPKVSIKYYDPHLKPEPLPEGAEVSSQLTVFAGDLVHLFHDHGLLMDLLNCRNLAWGSTDDEPTNRLILLDTIPVDIAEPDFTGVRMPLWTPALHLEALADFALNHLGSEGVEVGVSWEEIIGRAP